MALYSRARAHDQGQGSELLSMLISIVHRRPQLGSESPFLGLSPLLYPHREIAKERVRGAYEIKRVAAKLI